MELPHRDEDEVLTLHNHYFLAAELMLTSHAQVLKKQSRLKNPEAHNWKRRVYFSAWLGYLGVTCEGFKTINPWLTLGKRPEDFKELMFLSARITKLIKKHDNALRKFRNSAFHLREDTSAAKDFILGSEDRVAWATELHARFKEFFSHYRMLCELHYFTEDRLDESSLVKIK